MLTANRGIVSGCRTVREPFLSSHDEPHRIVVCCTDTGMLSRYAFANLRQTCLSLPLQPLMNVAATIDCDPHGGSAGGSTGSPPPPPPSPDVSEDTSR
jgi:hypothetical protein